MRRWWRERSLGTKSLTLLAVPLVVSAVLFVQSGVRPHDATELVAHTLAVKAQIATVSSLMIDAEAGVRGYLLTRSAESMGVYETATASLRPANARLAELVVNNADQVTLSAFRSWRHNSAVEGTGLGLSLSRGLSSAMGGIMGVESEVDRGTTFWLELPMERSEARDRARGA